jgi:hypothetical protein
MMKKNIVIITVLYLLCEVVYNLGLVEFLTSKNTEISVYNMLEDFGKFLSSAGLTLIIVKFLNEDKHKLIAACALIPVFFVTETVVFDHIVDNLSAKTKVEAYYAGVFRNGVLNGTIEGKSLAAPTPYNRVVLVDIASYGAGAAVRSSVDGLLYGANAKLEVDGLYQNYANLSERLNPLYDLYALESKKVADFKGRLADEATRRFEAKSHGIAPGLSRAQFFQALGRQSPSVARFNSTVFIASNEKLGIQGVKGSDLPLGMDKSAFAAFIHDQVAEASSKSRILESTVANLPYARELVASVVIPPIALLLSFCSIVLNSSVLLYSFKKPLAFVLGVLVVVAAYMAGPNVYELREPIHRAVVLEASFYRALSPVASAIHASFINDSKPNMAEVIVVKKPEPINFSDLAEQLQSMQREEVSGAPDVDPRVHVDEARLKREGAYYGELKVGDSPYTN